MSENFTWREQLKTNFKINILFSILWANPQGVTRAQMSQISGDGHYFPPKIAQDLNDIHIYKKEYHGSADLRTPNHPLLVKKNYAHFVILW